MTAATTAQHGRITYLSVDEDSLVNLSAELAEERLIAQADLIEASNFDLKNESLRAQNGEYALSLSRYEGRLIFNIQAAKQGVPDSSGSHQLQLSLTPFRKIVRDYVELCHHYYNAVRNEPASRVEAIDMARRGLHNEAGDILMQRLENKVDLDHETSRKLVTVICGFIEGADDV